MHSNASSHQRLRALPSTSSLAAALGPETLLVTPADSEPLRKKDGTLSKIRSHRGNIPALPQTKLCPHCPAKFTRTTHLNRHLRNHTNERLHCCETCNSQFTRSDLLNRHKKSCNNHPTRFRRRSCVACMESKMKCDRQVPCSRCISRRNECVYGPPTRKRLGTTWTADDSSIASLHYTERNDPPSIFNTSSWHTPSHPNRVSSSTPSYSNHISSSSASTRSFESLYSTKTAGIGHTHDSQSPKGNQPEVHLTGPLVEPFVRTSPSAPILPDYSLNQYPGGYLTECAVEAYSHTNPPTTDDHLVPITSHSSPTYDSGDRRVDLAHRLFTPVHIFFTTFLTQIPIFHAPTFRAEAKSPILLGAMQACGALFVGNERASNFISTTLAYARETLVHDFARKSSDPLDQIQLILAVVLLQTIGLFHHDIDQRASSNIYHGMLVMMIRQAGLISRNAKWEPCPLDESNFEEGWLDWARHEMAKRAILWSYMQDCCHRIYFSLPSSYHPHEMTLNLPCESFLWQATTAAEWYDILQRPSPYGSTQASRLTGVSTPKMVAYLSEMRTIPAAVPLSDIAHFVLIHIFLKQLFEHCMREKLTVSDPAVEGEEMDLELLTLQLAMHNWLQNWKASRDSQTETRSSEPPMIQNLLPFYWLGQVAILAYQEGLPPFECNSCDNLNAEVRFRLLKRWLRHIRNFLKSRDEATTLYWDELMQLRLHSWPQEDSGEFGEESLLEFF
ncbi:hypothetical protein AGABI1DRAFT_71303 [Agaricus bisporus var. burnettii JB137-S8]|uniref:Zn(2)-C6 fungal-type domain-containing protein n=1 Tax=Agaricus bisporus var. burnettii (strain JB137-S8 / ATCC MYA-4627 / FGSC 10392) TaxID=597362 RepID=K5WZ30_AGABU|nr:uncharacterized protein AGABI1DRAFT_71303 [Agaricus bisporus var. burnettii JB137-S8]EKM80781.1 hypothetical protein AGABI1DRAFT_71303 [Agaricus bisporus var. burnettii JB137-S8]